MPKTRKPAYRAAATAAGMVAAGLIMGIPPAHADTHKINIQLINSGGNLCLNSSANGSVSLNPCNGEQSQRWNVTSYASDVNNYYSRVQLKDVATGLCLRVHVDRNWLSSTLVVKTDSCDDTNTEDQWNMTWVGNVAGNPANGVQFFNLAGANSHYKGSCLSDATQLIDGVNALSNGLPTCQVQNDQYDIWKTQA